MIGYEPPDPQDTSGGANQSGNANQQQQQQGASNNRQSMQRSASVATVMSELPSVRYDTFKTPGQFLAGGRVDPTARALSKSYKKTSGGEGSERLGIPPLLPGQSVEMTDSMRALHDSEETNLACEKDKGSSSEDKSNEGKVIRTRHLGPSTLNDNGGHTNDGYEAGQEGDELKTVYVQRVNVKSANNDEEQSSMRHRKEPTGMPDVHM